MTGGSAEEPRRRLAAQLGRRCRAECGSVGHGAFEVAGDPLRSVRGGGSRRAAAVVRPRSRRARRSASGRSRRGRRGRRAPRRSARRSRAWWMAARSAATRSSPARCSMPIAPCATAGSMSSAATGVRGAAIPSRRSPAMARKVAAATPSRACAAGSATLPRNSTTARSGRRMQELRPPPQARGADDGAGRQRREARWPPSVTKASRTSSRGKQAVDREARRLQRRHVLHRVDGDVDARRPPAPPRSRG